MFFFLVMCIAFMGDLTNGYCPDECVCDNEEIFCKVIEVPKDIPNNTQTVFLELEHTESLVVTENRIPFSGPSWKFVKRLHFKVRNGGYLPGRLFANLQTLKFLLVRIPHLENMSEYIFEGLDSLETLDWSDHRYLPLQHVIRGLNYSPIRSLQSLILRKIQIYYVAPVDFDSFFFWTIRKIRFLDLSEVNINSINYTYLYHVCSTLEYIKLQNAWIGDPNNIVQPSCESLRVLDISGAIIPGISNFLDASDFVCNNFRVYSHVEKLYLNNIFKESSGLVLDKIVVTLTDCDFHIKELYAAYNNFKWLNVSIMVSNSTSGLTLLDVSHNKLEYISPLLFKPSPNLQTLNMSYNQLGAMQRDFPEDFVDIFNVLKDLRDLHLADNHLTDVPTNTFLENRKLQLLDLSRNRISRFSLDISHMDDLKLLNLSRNLIKVIGESSRVRLSNLQTNRSGTVKFKLDISLNQLQCECRSDTFINWVRTSSVISNNSQDYYCVLKSKTFNIFDVSRLEKSCESNAFLPYLFVGLATAAAFIMAILIVFVTKKKCNRRKRYMDVINAIQRNADDNFIVFLSHCSEDRDKADKIYNRLNQELKDITQVDRDHVSYGDRDFRPGFSVYQEVTRALENSSVVVCLVSAMFCQKNWCQIELRQALQLQKLVLLIMLEHVNRQYMNPLMQDSFDRFTHASWTDDEGSGTMEPDWPLLCASIIELRAASNV